MLAALGGSAVDRNLQALLFLYCRAPGEGAPYHFVPYPCGAYSFTAHANQRKLIAGELLADADRWQLTPAGEAVAAPISAQLQAFAEHYRAVICTELAREFYLRFPYYATRSEDVADILTADRQALGRVAAERCATHEAALQTLGHEGHSLESYLNRLLKPGTSVLCDVRLNPLSRKFGLTGPSARDQGVEAGALLDCGCAGLSAWH